MFKIKVLACLLLYNSIVTKHSFNAFLVIIKISISATETIWERQIKNKNDRNAQLFIYKAIYKHLKQKNEFIL